jgi:NADH dehydrogenase
LIVAVGAMHSYFGHPEWEQLAPGLKTIVDAESIRERILLAFEKAERCDSWSEAEKYLTFVVVGGGPTGVEMAGAIAEIARKTLFNNFRKIKPEQSKIYLIEGLPEILPSFPASLGAHARHDLEKLGVRVLTKTFVTNITEQGVYTKDQFFESPNVIWAAGNAASPLLASLSVPLDKQGRVLVQADLTIPDYSNIFVIGDAAALEDKKGQWLPGIAPVAIQQGRYVAQLIKKKIGPQERKAFDYFDKGNMATIGKAKAIATIGNLKITGYLAWLAWCFIHIAYLISFSNRMLVMFQWMVWYLTGKRKVRLITKPIEDE